MLAIFLVVLVDVFALTLVLPLLGIYAERFGASPFEATLLVSVFAAGQLLAGPVLGRLSDRFGRKPLLIVSQCGTLIGLVIMAKAPSLTWLFVGRIIDGLTAGNLSLAQAYIADVTRPEDRARSFAIIGIAFGLGFFVGPAVTSLLVGHGLAAPFSLAAALSALSVVASATLLRGGPPPSRPAESDDGPGGRRLGVFEWGRYAEYLRRPVLAGLFAQLFLYLFSFSLFTSGFALFAERRFSWRGEPFTPREIGWVFAYAGLLGIVLQGGLIGRLVKRFGEPALVTSGFVALVLSYAWLGLSHTVGGLVLATTISSFGNGVLRPVLTSLISQSVERSETGVVLGLGQSLSSLAGILAPALGGQLLTAGWLGPWAWMSGSAALVGLVALRWGSARFVPVERAPSTT